MSSNVKDFVDMAVVYGVKHLGTSMAATTPGIIKVVLKRRYQGQLSIAAWRGYAKLITNISKYYVGKEVTGTNRA